MQLADIRENQLTLASVVATVFSVHHCVKAMNGACVGATEDQEIDDQPTYSIRDPTDPCQYYEPREKH